MTVGKRNAPAGGRTGLTLLAPGLIIILFLAAIAGCGSAKEAKESPRWVQTEVYFGRNIPAGGAVSEEQFARFLDGAMHAVRRRRAAPRGTDRNR